MELGMSLGVWPQHTLVSRSRNPTFLSETFRHYSHEFSFSAVKHFVDFKIWMSFMHDLDAVLCYCGAFRPGWCILRVIMW